MSYEAVSHHRLNSDCAHCSQQCKAVVNQCKGHSRVWSRSGLCHMRLLIITGSTVIALWHEGQFGQKVGCARDRGPPVMARRPIWAKGRSRERSRTTSHHGQSSEPPVIMGKGRNHRSSWAKFGTTGHHGQKVGTTGHHGQRVGCARDRWTTSYGTKANLGKR